MKNLKSFEANFKGRDFVIGDLHGSFSVFLNLLDNLQFDHEVDRMFSVGDLVDRGPDNIECLRLIYEPWFHCTKSNHNQLVIDAFLKDDPALKDYVSSMANTRLWQQCGGLWALPQTENHYEALKHGEKYDARTLELIELAYKLNSDPFIITVELRSKKKVHIIHAEFPDVELSDDILEDEVSVQRIVDIGSLDGPDLLWKRDRFIRINSEDLSQRAKNIRILQEQFKGDLKVNDNLGHIISGHTPMQKPVTILGRTNIDTFACGSYPRGPYKTVKYKSSALTALELNTWKFYQATSTEFREVQAEVFNEEDLIV